MGGVDKVKRQRDQGRLTVRERIDKLVDQKSFHEIGAISGIAEYDEHGQLTNLTPANWPRRWRTIFAFLSSG
jgi:acetyl-CoA carboxylase carboxyltransferase component